MAGFDWSQHEGAKPAGNGVPPVEANLGAWNESSRLAYNPLDISPGSTLKLHDVDFEGLELEVTQVLGTTIRCGGEKYEITDYVLVGPMTSATAALADSDGNVHVRLRCAQDDRGSLDVVVFQAQALEREGTHSFNLLAAEDGLVTLKNALGVREQGFERVDGAVDVYRGRRLVIGGAGSEGSLVTREIESLDYCREQFDQEGRPYTQWALVEHNPESHDVITLFGWSIDPYSIERVGR